MKKISLIVFSLLLVIFSTGCEKKIDYSNRISQLRTTILIGETENLSIICFAELREQPYIADGNVDEKVNTLIFKFTAKKSNQENVICKFQCENDYSFELQKSDLVYGCVESIIVDSLPTNGLVISVNDKPVSLSAVDLSGAISFEDAIKSTKEKNSHLFDNVNCSELQIRLIYENDTIFWFVGIIDAENTNAFLINGKTGEIIAEKIIRNSN